jgi:hypothetical protein
MNLRRRKPHDSLYMLLDTMCNAFGGIILLAVLVVLLTSREKTQSAAAGDSQEMLERRLALAETNLQHSLQLAASLQAEANDDSHKTQMSLLTTRQQLQEEIKLIRELAAKSAKEIDANANDDPSDRLKKLNAQLAESEVKKATARNSIAASEQQEKQAAARLASLEKKMADVVKQSERELRLPKEHSTERQVAYVIVQYHRIYICHNVDQSRNEVDIQWTDSRGGVETAEPRKNKGLDAVANASELRTYFTTQAKNSVYVVFIAIEDSFPEFIRVKQLAVESGIPYGWVPWRLKEDGSLSFSAVGSAPPPQ